jgi:hypothetical protein
MKKKSIKQHIINSSKSFCCGLPRNNQSIKSAFFEEDILYDNDCNPVDHVSMDSICRNCLKLSHPTLYDSLLKLKQMNQYIKSLPKNNRQRIINNAKTRKNRIIQFNQRTNRANVIYLSYVPVPITDPRFLLEAPINESKCKVISKPNTIKFKPNTIKKETIQSITVNQSDSNEYEESFIEFNANLAIVRGFGNYWKVIYKNDDSTIEDLTNWIPYGAAYAQASELAA